MGKTGGGCPILPGVLFRPGFWHDAGMTQNISSPMPPSSTPLSVRVPPALPGRVGDVLVRAAARYGVSVTVTTMPADIDLSDMLDGSRRVRLGLVLDMIRRHSVTGPAPVILGMFEFLPADLALRGADGIVTRLTEKERDLLLVLLAARGAAVARDVLLDQVWGFAPGVETHTLETHIYRLRQKLETDPAAPVILTTDGDGYRLIVG